MNRPNDTIKSGDTAQQWIHDSIACERGDYMAIMLGKNLRMLRNHNNFTLEQVAEIIGVSRQSVAKWEANETYPDIENCVKLSALYRVSLDALVKEPIHEPTDEPNPDDENQYMFGIVRIDENGTIKLPAKAKNLLDIESDDRLLILGDKRKGLAIVKCDGINDYLNSEE